MTFSCCSSTPTHTSWRCPHNALVQGCTADDFTDLSWVNGSADRQMRTNFSSVTITHCLTNNSASLYWPYCDGFLCSFELWLSIVYCNWCSGGLERTRSEFRTHTLMLHATHRLKAPEPWGHPVTGLTLAQPLGSHDICVWNKCSF